MPTFKPEVDQVYTGVRKLRRRRKVRFAVAAAVVLAIPAVWVGIDRASDSPPPAPAASQQRKVNVPGVTIIEKPVVQFVDANTGWAVYNFCSVHNNPMCQYAAGMTTDGGRNWRGIRLPDVPDDWGLSITGISAAEFYLVARKNRQNEPPFDELFWSTHDGGATFASLARPAWLTVLANADRRSYKIECPGQYTGQEYVPDLSCTTKLVKAGAGPVQPQPEGVDYRSHVMTGGDGRIWLLSRNETQPQRLRVSADEGKSWQEVPPIPAKAWIYPSPDGTEMYYSLHAEFSPVTEVKTPGEIARLVEGKWVRQLEVISRSGSNMLPLGDGALLVSEFAEYGGYGSVRFFKDGAEHFPPPLIAKTEIAGAPLRDGTVVLQSPLGLYLGVGNGLDREWTLIAY